MTPQPARSGPAHVGGDQGGRGYRHGPRFCSVSLGLSDSTCHRCRARSRCRRRSIGSVQVRSSSSPTFMAAGNIGGRLKPNPRVEVGPNRRRFGCQCHAEGCWNPRPRSKQLNQCRTGIAVASACVETNPRKLRHSASKRGSRHHRSPRPGRFREIHRQQRSKRRGEDAGFPVQEDARDNDRRDEQQIREGRVCPEQQASDAGCNENQQSGTSPGEKTRQRTSALQ